MGSGASSAVTASVQAASEEELMHALQGLSIQCRSKLEIAMKPSLANANGSARRVSADEIQFLLSDSSGNILDDWKLLEALEAFRGSSISEAQKDILMNQMGEACNVTASLLDELKDLEPVIEKAFQEVGENIRVIKSELEKQKSFLGACTSDEKEQLTDRVTVLEQTLQDATAKDAELERSRHTVMQRRNFGVRLLDAFEKARHYLQNTFIVTVLICKDSDSEVVNCLSVAGENLIPKQAADINYGSLMQALQEIAPQGTFIQLLAHNGTVIDDRTADAELVKFCLEKCGAL